MSLNRCKVIIFDLDGVLWDSSTIHANAYEYVFNFFNLPRVDYKFLAGRRTDEVLKHSFLQKDGYLDSDKLNLAIKMKRDFASKELRRNPPIVKNCKKTLLKLRERYRLVLASSSRRENVNIFLNKLGANSLFEYSISGDDVSMGKPSPEIYELALKKGGLLANECVVIEDSLSGIVAAKLTRIPCIGIVGTHDAKTLRESHVLQVISELEEIYYLS
jgi:beta-phosphoglucomutase